MMVSQAKSARPLGDTEGATTSEVAPIFSGPVTLSLPCPPSVNDAFFNLTDRRGNSKGRKVKRHVRDWRDYALRIIAEQYQGDPITTRVLIVVNVERANFNADIDNRMKLLFDALVKGKVIKDDSLITGFAAAWAEPGTKRARLAIFPVNTLSIDFHPSAKHDGACGGWFFNAPSSPEEEAA